MAYKVKGTIIKSLTALDLKKKPYESKCFKTQEEAMRHGYSKVYKKDGNTKRTLNVLTDFQIFQVKKGKKL